MKAATFNITDTYNSNITAASQGKVVRRRSASSITLWLLVAVAGAALLVWSANMPDQKTSLYSAALIFGISALIAGFSVAIFGGKQWIYLPTKSTVKLHSYYIDPELQYAVCQAIEMRDISMLPQLKALHTSNVRLDVYVSKDGQFAGAQTFTYEPYAYKAMTPICTAYGDQAKALSIRI